MAGQDNYNKMAYNGAQPGPIMNQPLSANQIQHHVNSKITVLPPVVKKRVQNKISKTKI